MSYKVKNTVESSLGPRPKDSIEKERSNEKFDPVLMNEFLEGSKEMSELNMKFQQELERDPVLASNPGYYDLTKNEQRELTALKVERLSTYLEHQTFAEYNKKANLISVFDPQVNTRIGINLGLFTNCIRGNGTTEQLKFWVHDKETIKLKGIYGCFAMTELAHGSNVAGLETTATFDEKTDEFIINTPHIGATKWWIGGAAHSATHSACYARLIVKGKDYGVKTFVVPLRDSNHNLMPGVVCGDIGAKMGRDGIDNGWIQYSNVRIPRYFMLQKFAKVSREGEVTLPPLEQLSYSALIGGRVMMVLDSYRVGARFSTIALRYAVGRRQFKSDNKNKLETQLLDYPLHQRRLLPYLALTYVISSGAYKLEHSMNTTLDNLDEAVNKNDMKQIGKSIFEMKSLFIDSASLKSTCTWLAADCIDQCRQACGGHGYSAYNGFGKAYNDWVVQCTWEGDNNVLAMSVGKPLIRAIGDVLSGKKATGSISFLNNTQYLNEESILKNISDVEDLSKILLAIEVLIIRLCKDSLDTIKENKGSYEVVSGAMVTISKLKAHHYLLDEFLRRLPSADSSLKPYLTLIAKVYATTIILDKFSGDFLTYSVLSPKLMGEVNQKLIPKLCLDVRPLAINYTDSFQQTDMLLNSAIGKYNGDIYENYFGIVKNQNNPFNSKAPYSAALENMLNRTSLNERQRGERTEEVGKILSK